MNEQEEFFSPDHKRLLNIATWAKHLTTVVLLVFTISAGLQIIQVQNTANYNSEFFPNLLGFIKNNPWGAFSVGTNVAATLLKGIVYFLILEGVSLGLNMIVETDINYREKKAGQDE